MDLGDQNEEQCLVGNLAGQYVPDTQAIHRRYAAFATLVGLADPLTHSPPMRLKAQIEHEASHSVTDISL